MSRLPTIVLALAFLGACGTVLSDAGCPPLTAYTREEQRQLADELAQMNGRYPMAERAIGDYGSLRAQCRVTR